MTETPTTANREYPQPHPSNEPAEDVARIIAALDAIDADVAAILSDLAAKAEAGHTHTIAEITNLASTLAAKAEANHNHTIRSLSDVDLTGAPVGRPLVTTSDGKVSYGVAIAANAAALALSAAIAGIAGTNVQAALEALATGKAPIDGVAGNWSVGGEFNVGGYWFKLAPVTGPANLGVLSSDNNANVQIGGAEGHLRTILFLTNGIARWMLYVNGAEETGNDAGSNFSLASRRDDGTASATIFAVDRASHVMRIYSELQVPGQAVGDNSLRAANTAYVKAVRDAVLWVRDERPSGEGGSPPVTQDWFARTLQTIEANNIAGASLNADQITLPAGTYTIQASAQVLATQHSRLRLYNVTENASLVEGPMVYARESYSHQIDQHLMGRFVLSAPATLELQQIVARNPGSAGLGLADPWSQATVFAEAFIRRIA
ncbi:hypothetical protein [Breoghania sp. JC706]|uniref:hypothetical protein n=1 Tax=Breoghania sp. JC706 TaxID=3117732 RepID=UPI003008F4F4